MKRIYWGFVGMIILMIAGGSLIVLGQWNPETKTFNPRDGEVVFYDSSQCKGEPYMVLKRGNYPDFRSYNTGGSGSPNWNDRVSCLQVGPNTNVTVYQHINYGGKSKTFNRTRSNPNGLFSLSGDWWDNSISSCKIP